MEKPPAKKNSKPFRCASPIFKMYCYEPFCPSNHGSVGQIDPQVRIKRGHAIPWKMEDAVHPQLHPMVVDLSGRGHDLVWPLASEGQEDQLDAIDAEIQNRSSAIFLSG